MGEFQLPVKKVYAALQHLPVPFLYSHQVNALAPILDAFVNKTESTKYPQLKTAYEAFVKKSIEITKNELSRLLNEINDPDGTTNKLFMPTSEQDIVKLHTAKPESLIGEFLSKFQSDLHDAALAFESEKRELMKGNLKNQISKWWLLLIKTRTELILAQTDYDSSAWNDDTYIDEPPQDIDGVLNNLIIVQDILNPKHSSHTIVTEATEDIKSVVYPVIDDFIMKAHVVLSHELLGQEISLDYSADDFNLAQVREAFDKQKEKILASEDGENHYKQLDGLMKDLKYLVEMKHLEYRTAVDRESSTGGKLELSYAVPPAAVAALEETEKAESSPESASSTPKSKKNNKRVKEEKISDGEEKDSSKEGTPSVKKKRRKKAPVDGENRPRRRKKSIICEEEPNPVLATTPERKKVRRAKSQKNLAAMRKKGDESLSPRRTKKKRKKSIATESLTESSDTPVATN